MDLVLQDFAERAVDYAMKTNVQYCDARAEQQQRKTILLENGQVEHLRINNKKGIGIRIIKGGVWSFCSIANPESFDQIREAIDDSIRDARHGTKDRIDLYPSAACKSKINFPVLSEPGIEQMLEIGSQCDEIIAGVPRIIRSTVNPGYAVNSKYFVSSEGSQILQNFTDTIVEMEATSHESGMTQSVNATLGGRGGLEQITKNDEIFSCAKQIALKASQLIDAKPLKEQKTTVVMDPDFVALLTHEILGHPSEADRVLGKEMAWAGDAWWKGRLGHRVGSESLNVYDDPRIKESLGWYYFDDEGIKTKKTTLIEDGILKSHMQNRETAQAFNTAPTGNMRATDYRFMPLIRMACTCIGDGDWGVDEMIKDVKEGYMISGMKVPSIDMRRYNWSISCQYAQKIENGDIVPGLLRDVIVTGTAPEFFESIDACGDDFTTRPITNCGKGDPMQSMMMGNGGPTIRGVATVRSGEGK